MSAPSLSGKIVVKVVYGAISKTVAFDEPVTVRQALFTTATVLGELGVEVPDVINYNFYHDPSIQSSFIAEQSSGFKEAFWLDKKKTLKSYGFPAGIHLEFKKSADFNSAVEENRRLSCSPKATGRLQLDDENENVKFLTKGRFTRNEATKEIVTTEATYVEQLEILVTMFIDPALDQQLVTNKYVVDMFKQIRTIWSLHQQILQQMQERLDTWSAATGIGDVFVKIVPFLKMYGDYCLNYESNLTDLFQAAEDQPELKEFIFQTEYSEKFTLNNLGAYLILPVQRIPRYRLLFEQLLKFTPKNHDDYPKLSDVLEKINDIAKYVNSYQGKDRKMFEANENITGVPFTLVLPTRRYVREGVLKYVGKRSQERRVFLFTDLLIVCGAKKPPYVYKASILFDGSTWFTSSEDEGKIKNGFHVVGEEQTMTFMCSSPSEKQNWMNSFANIARTLAERNPEVTTKHELKLPARGGFLKKFGK